MNYDKGQDNFHKSVLLKEVIDYLRIKKGRKYIDATLGGGGHTGAILEKGGIVLGLDIDHDALRYVRKNFQFAISNLQLKISKGNFREIDKIAIENSFDNVDGIILDLGVSSYQLDTASRGFSIKNAGPLDMRMDKDLSISAYDLIKILTKKELYELFNRFGEEVNARAISEGIVSARKLEDIQTTDQLAEIVKRSVRRSNKKIHPATLVFQALRIAVNDELGSLMTALPKAFELLGSKGRLAVISFHSLEDRIVKQEFRKWHEIGKGKIVAKKPVMASSLEMENNPRSRSAKLRVIEKNE